MYDLCSIHRRNAGASLIEINERMSELLDNQVWCTERKSEYKNSASSRKVCDENKERRIRRKMTAM